MRATTYARSLVRIVHLDVIALEDVADVQI